MWYSSRVGPARKQLSHEMNYGVSHGRLLELTSKFRNSMSGQGGPTIVRLLRLPATPCRLARGQLYTCMVEIRQIDRSDRSTVGQMHREGSFTFAESSEKCVVCQVAGLGPVSTSAIETCNQRCRRTGGRMDDKDQRANVSTRAATF